MVYIDRERLINALTDIVEDYKEEHTFSCDFAAAIVVDVIEDTVKTIPAADVSEVKHGEWLDNHNGTFVCSVCRGKSPRKRWCGDCGAKMDGGKTE